MNIVASLKQFYAVDSEPTLETKLVAASKTYECGSLTPPKAKATTEDAINWREHVRRYHNGSFDPSIEKCEVYERMKRAEEEQEMLEHSDADGDGNADDYSSFAKMNRKDKTEVMTEEGKTDTKASNHESRQM